MPEFPIEQDSDAIMQIAYSVPDLHASIAWWIEEMGVGPWFVFDRIGGGTYRGEPGEADFTIAMAYSGKMMYELIQPLDDKPSLHREAKTRGTAAFHHFGKMRSNVQALAEALEAKGHPIVFHSPTPGGGQVYFLEGGQDALGYIELIEDAPATRGIFEGVWRASLDWNGERPIRSFSELMD